MTHPRLDRCVRPRVIALAAAALAMTASAAHAQKQVVDPMLTRTEPTRFETAPYVKATIIPMSTTTTPKAGGGNEGGIAGVCPPVERTYTNANYFTGTTTIPMLLQQGMVETEIAAVTYVLPPEAFPVIIRTVDMIWGRSASSVVQTTNYSVMYWAGAPNTGTLEEVFSSSSDPGDPPPIIIQPGSSPSGVIVRIEIDPGDPDQVVIQDNGSHSFTVGFRIDDHNNEPTAICACLSGCPISLCGQLPAVCCPPLANQNTFPATDTDGHGGTGQYNWLYARPCPGATCSVLAGWFNFNTAGTPSGDWLIRAVYEPFGCNEPTGACCLNAGTLCAAGLTAGDCTAAGGTYRGDGSTCDTPCPQPMGACCINGACSQQTAADCAAQNGTFIGVGVACSSSTCRGACCVPSTGNCVFTTQPNCNTAQGLFQGIGVTCASIVCFPTGACCLPNGDCANGPMSPGACEALGGIFQGNGSSCATVSCPEPIGACCLGTACIGDETEDNCTQGFGGVWAGPNSACEQFTCPYCPADVQANGVVNIDDLLVIISSWGACAGCPADIHPVPYGNNQVNIDDLLLVISEWGSCG